MALKANASTSLAALLKQYVVSGIPKFERGKLMGYERFERHG